MKKAILGIFLVVFLSLLPTYASRIFQQAAARIGGEALPITYVVISALFVLIVFELLWRIGNGASVTDLFKDAFYEVISIRWISIAFIFIAFSTAVSYTVLFARGLWAMYDNHQRFGAADWSLLVWVLWPVACGLAALFTGLAVLQWINSADAREKPASITIKSISENIDISEIANIGKEKFPNRDKPAAITPILIRLVLLAIFIYAIVLVFQKTTTLQYNGYVLTENAMRDVANFYVNHNLGLIGIEGAASMLAPYVATILLLLFTFTNREYLYFKPATMCVFMATLMFVAGYWTVYIKNQDTLTLIIIAILFIPVTRIALDLGSVVYHLWRYSRIDPISAELGNAFRQDLAEMIDGAARYYPSIDEAELIRRLERGAFNVSKRALLCPPRMGRYMKNAAIKWRRCATAIGRFMTVARSLQLVNARSTTDSLRHPEPPVWNEALFPLNPPNGYATRTDAIVLGPQWCVVAKCSTCWGSGRVSCSSCGGSGSVSRTETRSETQYVDGKSVTVYATVTFYETCPSCSGRGHVTCSTCDGTGALKYDQQLTTTWKSDVVYAPYPEMKCHELVSNAEEFDFANIKAIENREMLNEPADIFIGDQAPHGLEERMTAARKNFKGWSGRICDLHGGIIYRAELALSGFTMVCCSFRNIFVRSGWFFGNRPEFFLPRLPTDIATVGALVLTPAIAILVIMWGYEIFLVNWDGAAMAAATRQVEMAPPPIAPPIQAPPVTPKVQTPPPAQAQAQPPATPGPVQEAAPPREVAPPAARVVTVTARVANVRASPSRSAQVQGAAYAGTKLKVFQTDGDWVQVGDEQPLGWIHHSLLRD